MESKYPFSGQGGQPRRRVGQLGSRDGIRTPLGYWEAKDADDDLEAEMAAKFRKG